MRIVRRPISRACRITKARNCSKVSRSRAVLIMFLADTTPATHAKNVKAMVLSIVLIFPAGEYERSPRAIRTLDRHVETAQTSTSRIASQLKMRSVPITLGSGYSGFLPYACSKNDASRLKAPQKVAQ